MNANAMSSWSSLLVLLLLVAGKQNLATSMEVQQCDVDHFRLPERVLPRKYTVELELDRSLNEFSGKVWIQLDVESGYRWWQFLNERTISGNVHPYAQDPKRIIMHSDKLIVDDAWVEKAKNIIIATSVCHDTTSKIMVVKLPKKLRSGPAILYLSFKGTVQSEAKGLFRSSVDPTKVMLATHFKPDYARRLFPCFDEPEFKAIFQLTITHPAGTIAVSNMESSEPEEIDDGFLMTRFNPTPKMSSYLLGLAVGDFSTIHTISVSGIPIAIRAPLSWNKAASILLDQAEMAYDKVANYFTFEAPPLKKIDIVIVNMGPIAMESWGIINIRCDLLSADLNKIRPGDWIRVVTVLMSQMIHQQLGNLITMRWWDDLWLQEGLAAYLASELTAELPQMESTSYTLVDTVFSAMVEDKFEKARSIKNEKLKTAIQHVDEFDSLIYKKSVAVVRMFATFVGKHNFHSMIYVLIKSNSLSGLAVSQNWWAGFTQKFKQHGGIKKVAEDWTSNKGYPTILVALEQHEVTIRQLPQNAGGYIWSIPVQFEYHLGAKCKAGEMILTDSQVYSLRLPKDFNIEKKTHWFTFNPAYQGYYHVVYIGVHISLPNEILQAQKSARISFQIPAVDRLQMLSNCFLSNQEDSMDAFQRMLQSFAEYEETDDGVILLLTRILTEMPEDSLSLDSRKAVTKVMKYYYLQNGGISLLASSNMLKQYTRGQVVDYLVNRLEDQQVINEVTEFKTIFHRLPPFIEELMLQ